ncbi:hypothetical protein F5Y05DRAFT_418358 [Hypoxylon sp. FL0543]|nr:hypothetical protein F5Y05DRAFT_418358 [Hypoxylon sp. FL0543]
MAAYILGAACFGRGVMGVVSPRKEYGNVGLPLESYAPASPTAAHLDDPSSGFASPLMYFKGIREMSYGLTLIALHQQANEGALTTFAAILSLVRFGDGLVVWLHGGDELRYKAWGHWITGAGFLAWVVRRWYW